MGPLAELKFGPDMEHEQRAIRWIDNNENDKSKLVTNKSEEDLVYKEEVQKIDVHRTDVKPKSTIKPFALDMAFVTGVSSIHSARSSHRHTYSEADAKRL